MMNSYTNSRGMRPIFRGPRPYHARPRAHFPRGYGQQQWRLPVPSSNNGTQDEHWCETCDRGFPSIELLDRHKQQHQKCNIDGCQFIAHPKVITKHIQMQHSSGLYKKIAKLQNPEEIQKWRDERKKKYPTRSNIEKKAAENKEKIDRGEKMAMGREKRKHDSKPADGAHRNNSYDRNNRNQKPNRFNGKRKSIPQHSNAKDSPTMNKRQRPTPNIPVTEEKNKLQPFTGIMGIIDFEDKESEPEITTETNNDLIEDDFYEQSVEVKAAKSLDSQKPVLCGALTSLICDYDSSDEDIEEKDNNMKNALEPKNSNLIEKYTPNALKKQVPDKIDMPKLKKVVPAQVDKEVNKSDDDSGPEEVKVQKLSTTQLEPSIPQQTVTQNRAPVKNVSIKTNNQRQNNKMRYKVPSTLLHKLLHSEIRKERNTILQCIRFICKNEYFDKS